MAEETTVENNFSLKGGFSYSRVFFRSALLPETHVQGQDEDTSENNGFGLNSSIGYKWTNWEFLVGSDILFGKLDDLTFQLGSTSIRGDGSFRIFSISPMLRYYTPYTLFNRWNFFIGAGPTWSLHTFILSQTFDGTNFSDKKRISFENRGGSISLGLEEIVPYKEMHPTYIEVAYSYMRSKQIFIVDASDFKDVKTLSRGASKDFYGHYIVARIGFTLF